MDSKKVVETVIRINAEHKPAWLDALLQKVCCCWQSEGSVVFVVDPPGDRWQGWEVVMSPARREIKGGQEDGRQAWMPFSYNLGLLRRLFDKPPEIVIEGDGNGSPHTILVLTGPYQEMRLRLVLLGEPSQLQPVTEIAFAYGPQKGQVKVQVPDVPEE